VAVRVGLGVRVAVGAVVGLGVGVAVGALVAVDVRVGALVGEGPGVLVRVGVGVGPDAVGVRVGVLVGAGGGVVGVGVGVMDGGSGAGTALPVFASSSLCTRCASSSTCVDSSLICSVMPATATKSATMARSAMRIATNRRKRFMDVLLYGALRSGYPKWHASATSIQARPGPDLVVSCAAASCQNLLWVLCGGETSHRHQEKMRAVRAVENVRRFRGSSSQAGNRHPHYPIPHYPIPGRRTGGLGAVPCSANVDASGQSARIAECYCA